MNSGDERAFEVLYFRYRDWVGGLAKRFSGCDSLANDVLQETFIYFLRKFPGFELSSQFKTFLYPVVKNLSIKARRKVLKFNSGDDGQVVLDQAPAPDEPLGACENFLAVISGLSSDHREILILRFVDGFSMAEIAGATEIPLGTAKSRLHNALSRLREDPKTKEFFIR